MYILNIALLDLTWREIVSDIPLDATAIVFYAVCLGCGILIWYGSRSGGAQQPQRVAEDTEPADANEPHRMAPTQRSPRRSRGGRKGRRKDPRRINWIVS